MPALTTSTPLIEILTPPQGGDLLYRTITQIVCNNCTLIMCAIISLFRSILLTVFLKAWNAPLWLHKDTMLKWTKPKNKCSQKSVKLIAVLELLSGILWSELDVPCVHHCVSLRLDNLNELMPLISECCNPVTFSDTNNFLTSVDPKILPCCVPQLFDFVELQEDIIHSFVAGKSLLQSPQQIRMPFKFKEQSKPQKLPGNMWVHANSARAHHLYLCLLTDFKVLHFKWPRLIRNYCQSFRLPILLYSLICCICEMFCLHVCLYNRNVCRPEIKIYLKYPRDLANSP